VDAPSIFAASSSSRGILVEAWFITQINPGSPLDEWRVLTRHLSSPRNEVSTLERNFVLGGYPDLWERCDWKTALGWFRDDLARFGVETLA